MESSRGASCTLKVKIFEFVTYLFGIFFFELYILSVEFIYVYSDIIWTLPIVAVVSVKSAVARV